ncbi:Phox domain-containing, partial [Globisporangium splendens]
MGLDVFSEQDASVATASRSVSMDPETQWLRSTTHAKQPSSGTSSSSHNKDAHEPRMRRKSSAQKMQLLRKSMSDTSAHENAAAGVPGHTYHQSNYAQHTSVADFQQQHDELQSLLDPELLARRQLIMNRAEEILRGKRHVGMQFAGETCPVCLADDVDTQLTQCGHRIHAKCIKRWIQSGTRCPVCREQVTDVTEAFTPPSQSLFHALEKDREHPQSDSASTSHDEEQHGNNGFEWGWFEDFDEFDEQNDDSVHGALALSWGGSRRATMPGAFPSSTRSRSNSNQSQQAPLLNREMSGAFEICRTFPPLRPVYDTPYAISRHVWMRALPSHRHIAAKIQVRSFRIVEAKGSGAQHAEYLVELQLDGRYFSRWRRFSAISRFVSTIGSSEFRETHAVWRKLEASSRWFNRLELSYLHERCKLLEAFAHTLLIECHSAHPLADLLDS